jgi:hypothetical protein
MRMQYNFIFFLLLVILIPFISCSTISDHEPARLNENQPYTEQYMDDNGQLETSEEPQVDRQSMLSRYEFGVEFIGVDEIKIKIPFEIDNETFERYELYRYMRYGGFQEDGPRELLESGPRGQLNVIDSGLSENMTYCYVLVAYDNGGKKLDKTLEECQYTYGIPEPQNIDSSSTGVKILKGIGKGVLAIAYLALVTTPFIIYILL